ncbi:MAG: RagB/SusD family nutrient uptake outer membrane protein [Candidatus Ordinivivax streblomastigis]|uniref:RagB/SusD family nutrient uptake outer membrane protein n=1 Tax=Candidatus Ordinivivax streblomastigis TaxID=2540710 RepID=A0A5M8NYQ3_9BACT|nr:MAG: RagB/SusD family nutrient uptake outer membrane protein [Candidatus Ordinivivax streblomastigis]
MTKKFIVNRQLPVVLLFAIIVLSFLSCDFLNVNDYFNETLKYDSVFHKKENIERYLWATAAYFPDEGNLLGSTPMPGPLATDEGFCLTSNFGGSQYVLGAITPSTGGMQNWNTMYIVIRKANTVLARMNEAVDLTTFNKQDIMGYTYFLRAYAYYNLLMKYGPVVIIGDDILDNNESSEYYDMVRATFDESMEYVCAELEKAALYLPSEVPVTYFGRPSRGAALGLIARLRLIHASPLYNGQTAAHTYFGNWKRSTDGEYYVQQQYDESRWATAAYASKRIIDLDAYSLHTSPKVTDSYVPPANVPTDPFPDGAGDIDPYRSYADMFNGEDLAARNPELIWGRSSPGVESSSRYVFPVEVMGGYNCMGVTQKVIDAYRMADGRTIENASTEYPYLLEGVSRPRNFSAYEFRSDISNMYVNREMRFYASIGYSGCFWAANSTSATANKTRTVTYYLDGNAGQRAIFSLNSTGRLNYPITGYVLKKFVHPDDAWEGANASRIAKSYPIIRYAEILLSYVEALNNLTATHTITTEDGESVVLSRDKEEMRKYFNMVHFRVGLPGLTEDELNSPQTMQELIERERMVEFLFEDRRYFDVRRWGKYESSEKETIMGMNTDANLPEYYNIVPVNHSQARNRVIDKRMVLFPLELNEVRKAPSLDQNPGWQD